MAPQTRSTAESAPLLGTVLVVGGNGFFGFHLVRHLLRDEECGAVHVLDRDIDRNRHSDAIYTRGNITDAHAIDALLKQTRPRVIFHAASPPASLPAHRLSEFHETNVRGTQTLLAAAATSDSVQALVYTSTIDAYADPPHVDASEDDDGLLRLWGPSARTTEYNRTKAVADRLVLAADDGEGGGRLRTASLRPGHMYGERSTQGLPEVVGMCVGGGPLFQVGAGANLVEVASADNTAAAHVLAAKALVDRGRAGGEVGGEGFTVSDGHPVPFWYHVRSIWKAVRGEEGVKRVWVIPAWVMLVVVVFLDWAYWIFTLGRLCPPTELSMLSYTYATWSHTYSIEKARKRLGFKPIANHDEVVVQMVKWELDRREKLENDNLKKKS
ncbi:hypothetical protein QBC33DRAFT_603074 [Phialemonium atrogriseum]|uniref:3-beta hydroxysteroid dehydrogenase/isomerase domain-containing protein n=1 Tax=Phialemonium atrogriseum TaxID=1093897 RepID=A0AAJ0C4M5_9PEZI|nr:uncharacterized protein QBC33DRAFT_603074 [Phialemonium atrogriseum]KAK1770063.1 hypothetical protein QBC33DRAFT_603074 [Phialemonium atrogriseum]